ncbi:MAG TPA: response regulator, partial [Bryobacteraceae bacterium]|nr:response regulator [Bryobacteraceae bacterium]
MKPPAAQFRHDLRNALNHLIGYAEILTEELSDHPDGSEEHSSAALKEVIVRARELVRLLQTFPDETLPAQAREAVYRASLTEALDQLPPSLRHRHSEDFAKMLQAASSLTALVDEAPEAPSLATAVTQGAEADVLVVDDDPINRDLLRRMLERQGYSVTTAATGQDCLDLLSRHHFDLVLLDVIMPGLSGFDVLSRIREAADSRAVPVIVISALDESSAAIRCIQMGAEDYLPKPFDPVLLRARIGATLEKKRLRDQEAKHAKDLEQALIELHGAKDRLVVQEKLASLGALTAGIAHELKNPLNFITNFASLSREIVEDLEQELGRPEPDSAELRDLLKTLRENLDRIETHGKRADSIVRGMLLHSHGQPGRREAADMNALVDEALNLAYHGMRAQDSGFNVTIEKNLAGGLPPVPVVAQDISRVLVNILNNALYATAEKKRTAGADYMPCLRVTTRDAGDSVELILEDNGPGVSPGLAQKIFEPFFTTKPAGAGTGLGLSISYDIIVRAHEGSLTV